MERLATPVFLPLLIEESPDFDFIRAELVVAIASTGLPNLEELLRVEIRFFPRCKTLYEGLTEEERKRVWRLVDMI